MFVNNVDILTNVWTSIMCFSALTTISEMRPFFDPYFTVNSARISRLHVTIQSRTLQNTSLFIVPYFTVEDVIIRKSLYTSVIYEDPRYAEVCRVCVWQTSRGPGWHSLHAAWAHHMNVASWAQYSPAKHKMGNEILFIFHESVFFKFSMPSIF